MFCYRNDFFGCNVLHVNPLKCVSMNNQVCKVKAEIMNINSNEPLCYPDSVKISKCSVTCNNIMIHLQNYVFLICC